MKQKWAVSVLTSRVIGDTSYQHHTVFMAEALSRFEAEGLGMHIGKKLYKPAQGWKGHHVMVCSADHVIGPEQEVSITECP